MRISHLGLALKVPHLGGELHHDALVLGTERADLLGFLKFTEESGLTAYDAHINARNAAIHANCTPGGATWIDDSPALLINDGVVNWASLLPYFTPLEHTLYGWAYAPNDHWTDLSLTRYIVSYLSLANDYSSILKPKADYQLLSNHSAGGTGEQVYRYNINGTGWFQWALTVSKSANATKFFINGEKVGATDLAGDFAGNPLWLLIGAQNTTGGNPWGYAMSRVAAWSKALSETQIYNLYNSVSTVRRFLYIGDSKLNFAWSTLVRYRLRESDMTYYEQDYHDPGWTLIGYEEPYVVANYPSEPHAAHYALLVTGINEAYSMPSESAYKTALRSVIDTVRAKSSQTDFLINQPGGTGKDAECTTLAGWNHDVIDEYPSGVYVGVDEQHCMKDADNYATMLYDGIHPSAAGNLVLAGSMRAALDYLRIIKIPGCVGFWPCRERTGTNVEDVSRVAGDATATSPTWKQTGTGDGELAVAFDGVAGGIDLYTAALATAFNADEGTFALWVKMDDWSRAASEWLFEFQANGNNRIYCYKPSGGATLQAVLVSGGTDTIISKSSPSGAALVPVVVVWSRSESRFELWFDGTLADSDDLSAAPAWSGGAIATATAAQYVTGSYVLDGTIARISPFSRALSTSEIAELSTIVHT